MDESIRKSRDYVVVKDNRLIQNVSRRKYELSALEQKVLAYIISLIKPQQNITQKPFNEYEIDIKHFCAVCGIDIKNGKNYINVKNAIKRLADNSFWLNEGDDELLFQWIVTPRIKKNSGKIIVKISDDVMPYLHGLHERFTQYELYQVLAMKNPHSIALYEFLKSYAHRQIITIAIVDLKKYLSLEDRYKEYKGFRRKVIEPSITEINKFTDLKIEWTPCKQGRSIVSITFNITKKDQWDGWAAYRKTIDMLDNN